MAVPLAELLTAGGLVLHSFNHERTFDRPGAGVTVLFRIQAVDPDGAEITVYAGATTSPAAARGPALRTSVSGTQLFLWLHPRDPLLPDLAWALSPEDLARDVFAPGTRSAGVSVRVTGYRPLRRAVVHAASGRDSVYLKVLLPGQAEELRQRHRLLAGSEVPAAALRPGPAHRSAVVLEQLTGTPLLRGLAAGSHGLSAADLTGLLDELPAAALKLRRRPAWAERSQAYGQAAAALLPDQRMRVVALAAGVESLVAELDPGPVVPVHGTSMKETSWLRRDRSPVSWMLTGWVPGTGWTTSRVSSAIWRYLQGSRLTQPCLANSQLSRPGSNPRQPLPAAPRRH